MCVLCVRASYGQSSRVYRIAVDAHAAGLRPTGCGRLCTGLSFTAPVGDLVETALGEKRIGSCCALFTRINIGELTAPPQALLGAFVGLSRFFVSFFLKTLPTLALSHTHTCFLSRLLTLLFFAFLFRSVSLPLPATLSAPLSLPRVSSLSRHPPQSLLSPQPRLQFNRRR